MAIATSENRGEFQQLRNANDMGAATKIPRLPTANDSSRVVQRKGQLDQAMIEGLGDDPELKRLVELATRITMGKHPKLPPIDKAMSCSDEDIIGYLSWERDDQPKVLHPGDPQVKELRRAVNSMSDPALPQVSDRERLGAASPPMSVLPVNGRTSVSQRDYHLPTRNSQIPVPDRTSLGSILTSSRDRFKAERQRLEEALQNTADAEKAQHDNDEPDLYLLEKRLLPQLNASNAMPQTVSGEFRQPAKTSGEVSNLQKSQPTVVDSKGPLGQISKIEAPQPLRFPNILYPGSQLRSDGTMPVQAFPTSRLAETAGSSIDGRKIGGEGQAIVPVRLDRVGSRNHRREVTQRSPAAPVAQSPLQSADSISQGYARHQIHYSGDWTRSNVEPSSQRSGDEQPPPAPILTEFGQHTEPSHTNSLSNALIHDSDLTQALTNANHPILGIDSVSSEGSAKRKLADELTPPIKRAMLAIDPSHRHSNSGLPTRDGRDVGPASTAVLDPFRLSHDSVRSTANSVSNRPRRYRSPGGGVYHREDTPPRDGQSQVYLQPMAEQMPYEEDRLQQATLTYPHTPRVLQPIPVSAEQLQRMASLRENLITPSSLFEPAAQVEFDDHNEVEERMVEMVEVEQAPQFVEATDGRIYQVKRKPKLVPVLRRDPSGMIHKRPVLTSARRALLGEMAHPQSLERTRLLSRSQHRPRAVLAPRASIGQLKYDSEVRQVPVLLDSPVSQAVNVNQMMDLALSPSRRNDSQMDPPPAQHGAHRSTHGIHQVEVRQSSLYSQARPESSYLYQRPPRIVQQPPRQRVLYDQRIPTSYDQSSRHGWQPEELYERATQEEPIGPQNEHRVTRHQYVAEPAHIVRRSVSMASGMTGAEYRPAVHARTAYPQDLYFNSHQDAEHEVLMDERAGTTDAAYYTPVRYL